MSSPIVGFKCGPKKCLYAVGKDGAEHCVDIWECVEAVAPKQDRLRSLSGEQLSSSQLRPQLPSRASDDVEEIQPYVEERVSMEDSTLKGIDVWGGHLAVDGTFGSSTVKALQTYLKSQGNELDMSDLELDIDGIFGAATTKAVQTFLNAHWGEAGWKKEHLVIDGAFGPDTIKALQTFLNRRKKEASWRANPLHVDGVVGPSTIKSLQTFLNSHWLEAGWRSGDLVVDGNFGSSTIKALQTYLTKQFGMCGNFGPRTIKALQTFLNTHWDEAGWRNEYLPVDGIFSLFSIKALQTFLNSHWDEAGWRSSLLNVDGKFGASTVKALQTFLNTAARFAGAGNDGSGQVDGSPAVATPETPKRGSTPKSLSAWGGHLAVDGRFGPSTVKALQTFLSKHVKEYSGLVDGVFSAATTKALQMFFNARWGEAGWQSEPLVLDSAFGPCTIKALQTFLNTGWKEASWRASPLHVDGMFGVSTVKALQTFLNSHWGEASWRTGHLVVDGNFGSSTIKALQTFLTKQFGMCGTFGPRTIKALQTFLNTHWDEAGWRNEHLKGSGTFGPNTIKALQTFLNSRWDESCGWNRYLTVDGEFGVETVKALQTYLNRVHASVTRSLAPRSALKKRIGSSWFFRSGAKENVRTGSKDTVDSRRCSFAADNPSPNHPPEWYNEFFEALHEPGWQKQADAEAGVMIRQESPVNNVIGNIVGTMQSNNEWYYLMEVKNERRDAKEGDRMVVMRTYEDFQKLDQTLANKFSRNTMLKWSWQWGRDPNKFFEERREELQRYMDTIAVAFASDDIVTQFIRPRYLKSAQPSKPGDSTEDLSDALANMM